MFELRGKYNSCKVFTDLIEDSAVSQLTLLMNQEFCKDSKIRIMPDVHAGAGCTIGTTMTINDKIVPNLVGVDINCGMLCIQIQETAFDPQKLDNIIRQYVPSGHDIHETEDRTYTTGFVRYHRRYFAEVHRSRGVCGNRVLFSPRLCKYPTGVARLPY